MRVVIDTNVLVSAVIRPQGTTGQVLQQLRLVFLRSVMLQSHEKVTVCRDPKDDVYLELAIAGGAGYIVTGDADLLVLHTFRNIPIITPATSLTLI